MTEREAFIRSICEQPEDNLRRLAFADWLEENGEFALAVFIRSNIDNPHNQIRLGGGCHVTIGPANGKNWPTAKVAEFPAYYNRYSRSDSVAYTRGFLSHIMCSEKEFVKHAKRLFSDHPITFVSLIRKKPCRNLNGLYEWLWQSVTSGSTDSVYFKIWRLLPDTFSGFHSRLFHSTIDAMRGLSVACVSYGRSLAGLPPYRGSSR